MEERSSNNQHSKLISYSPDTSLSFFRLSLIDLGKYWLILSCCFCGVRLMYWQSQQHIYLCMTCFVEGKEQPCVLQEEWTW